MKYQAASPELCKGCKMLMTGNFMDGPSFCCRWFSPPKKLDQVECLQEQYGYGVLVEPRLRKNENSNPDRNSR